MSDVTYSMGAIELRCRLAISAAQSQGFLVLPRPLRESGKREHLSLTEACKATETVSGEFSTLTGHRIPDLEGGFDGWDLEDGESEEVYALGARLRKEQMAQAVQQ